MNRNEHGGRPSAVGGRDLGRGSRWINWRQSPKLDKDFRGGSLSRIKLQSPFPLLGGGQDLGRGSQSISRLRSPKLVNNFSKKKLSLSPRKRLLTNTFLKKRIKEAAITYNEPYRNKRHGYATSLNLAKSVDLERNSFKNCSFTDIGQNKSQTLGKYEINFERKLYNLKSYANEKNQMKNAMKKWDLTKLEEQKYFQRIKNKATIETFFYNQQTENETKALKELKRIKKEKFEKYRRLSQKSKDRSILKDSNTKPIVYKRPMILKQSFTKTKKCIPMINLHDEKNKFLKTYKIPKIGEKQQMNYRSTSEIENINEHENSMKKHYSENNCEQKECVTLIQTPNKLEIEINRNILTTISKKTKNIKRKSINRSKYSLARSQNNELKLNVSVTNFNDNNQLNIIKNKSQTTTSFEKNCLSQKTKQRSSLRKKPKTAAERMKKYRATQSQEDKEKRLQLCRERMRKLRSKKNAIDEFQKAVNNTANKVCKFCLKMCYATFKTKLNRSMCELLKVFNMDFQPEENVSLCHRCKTNIRKGCVTPVICGNNLQLSKIPEELATLSEYELRLITPIRPYIKITRLPGICGQKAVKGGVTHFAQRVMELPEQLPLSAKNCDMVIVTEKLENVQSSRKFQVSLNKLALALSWLQANNHLFKNIEIEMKDKEFSPTKITVIDNSKQEFLSYRNIKHERKILLGDFSQYRWYEKSCFENAIVAHCMSQIFEIEQWDKDVINRVLTYGAEMYRTRNATNDDCYLKNILQQTIKFERRCFNLKVIDEFQSDEKKCYADSKLLFLNTLENNLKSSMCGIIIFGKYVVSIQKQNDVVFVIDSHNVGKNGGVPRKISNGAACVIAFNGCDCYKKILKYLTLRCLKSEQKNITFSIFFLSISFREENLSTEVISHEEENVVECVMMPSDFEQPLLQNLEANGIQQNKFSLIRKTGAPVNFRLENRIEELSFVQMFPTGLNGWKEQRQLRITELDYFQSRILSCESRFQTPEYLFYALDMIERANILRSINICGRQRKEKNLTKIESIKRDLFVSMRQIRGSSSYWRQFQGDLIAMINNIGMPTWFLTLSCNDLQWPDMIRALYLAEYGSEEHQEENETDGKKNVARLVAKYPVIVMRQFWHRLHSLLHKVILKDDHIFGGKVVDYAFRVEFQARGSPHLHAFIWILNPPDFNTAAGIDIINKVCSVKSKTENKILDDLVAKFQVHKHTNTCYKQSNYCRFAFPRKASKETVILNNDDVLKSNGRFCCLKRDEGDEMINNYNDEILKIFESNMDIQPICKVNALVWYIAKYISKGEPEGLRLQIEKAIKCVESDNQGNHSRQLNIIAQSIIKHREVSAQEAAARICRIPLRLLSRKCVFVDTRAKEERVRMLKRYHYLDEVFANDVFLPNIIEKYENRPYELDHICLFEFASQYSFALKIKDCHEEEKEQCIGKKLKLLKNYGYIRQRGRAAVIKTPKISLQKDASAYYYHFLLLYLPFRNESDILISEEGKLFDTATAAFLEKKKLIRNNISQSCIIPQNILEELHRAFEKEVKNDIVPEIHSQESEYPESMFHVKKPNVILNDCQKGILANVKDQIQRDLTFDSNKSMFLFVSGEGGTGKSTLIREIIYLVNTSYQDKEKRLQNYVVVTAPTGIAAKNISGQTIHRAFCLGYEKNSSAKYIPLKGEKKERLAKLWKPVKWLIVDEISMVSYETLRLIDLRLRELKDCNEAFGNTNVIVVGDLLQLKPVNGHWVFDQPKSEVLKSTNLWHLFQYSELSKNERQNSDIAYGNICSRLRVGKTTAEDCVKLSSRLISNMNDNEKTIFDNSIHIFSTIAEAEALNKVKTKLLHKTFIVNSRNSSGNPNDYDKEIAISQLPKDPKNCAGFSHTLTIGIGSRVMLRRNIDTTAGLVNGVIGTVVKITWTCLRDDQLESGDIPEYVSIKFDDDTVGDGSNLKENGNVRIYPITVEFDCKAGVVRRTTLPLILSWAINIHKLQGITLDKAAICLGKRMFCSGLAYVALSRVTSLKGLGLLKFNPNVLFSNKPDQHAFAEFQRLQANKNQNNINDFDKFMKVEDLIEETQQNKHISENFENKDNIDKPSNLFTEDKRALTEIHPLIRDVCYAVSVKGDGNCFYYAISICLTGSPDLWRELRHEISKTIQENEDFYRNLLENTCATENFDVWLDEVKTDGCWANEYTIHAAMKTVKKPIYIFTSFKKFKENEFIYLPSVSNMNELRAKIENEPGFSCHVRYEDAECSENPISLLLYSNHFVPLIPKIPSVSLPKPQSHQFRNFIIN